MSQYYHPFRFNPPKELPNPGAFAYRYYDVRRGEYYYDWEGEIIGIRGRYSKIELDVLTVKRFTPKGFVIDMGGGTEKFICHAWKKKYAHLNLEQARESFRRRKLRQYEIYSDKLHACKAVLSAIERDAWEGKCYSHGVITFDEKHPKLDKFY